MKVNIPVCETDRLADIQSESRHDSVRCLQQLPASDAQGALADTKRSIEVMTSTHFMQ